MHKTEHAGHSVLKENDSIYVCLLGPYSWNCLRRVSRYDFVGRGVSLVAGFEVSRTCLISSVPLFVSYLLIKI